MIRLEWTKVSERHFVCTHGKFTFRKKLLSACYTYQVWQGEQILLSTSTEKKFMRQVNAIFTSGETEETGRPQSKQ